jgi:NADPH:quinone reductase-like Zn-dependent oxidoreductase
VHKLTDGKGVDVIIENVATDNLAKDFIAVAAAGRIVLIGTGTGKTADATFGVLGALMKDATMYGMSLINAGAAVPQMAATLTRLFTERKIKAVVSKTYPLSEAPLACPICWQEKSLASWYLRPSRVSGNSHFDGAV